MCPFVTLLRLEYFITLIGISSLFIDFVFTHVDRTGNDLMVIMLS